MNRMPAARALLLAVLFVLIPILGQAGEERPGAVKREPMTDDEIIAGLNPNDPLDREVLHARAAVAAEPYSVEAHVSLGNLYLVIGLIQEALIEFERSVELDPESTIAWNNVGILQDLLGDTAAARKAFEQSVSLDPRNAEAHYNLGAIFELERNFDSAVLHYREALRLRPSLAHPVNNPRSNQAKLLLPAIVSLYLETSGSATLPPLGPNGESALPIPVDRELPPEEPPPPPPPAIEAAPETAPAEATTDAAEMEAPPPEPINVGPGGVTEPVKESPPAGPSRRTIRYGGPPKSDDNDDDDD